MPIIGAIKFGMMNFTSNGVKPLDMSRTAKVLAGNGVKESLLSPDYNLFPEIAIVRFDQERGEQLGRERVRIPKAVDV